MSWFVVAFTCALLVYMLVMYIIGYVAQRRVTNVDDYVLAGRSLPVSLTTITIIATWYGAESLMTTTDEVAASGWRGALLDPIGISLCLIITGTFIAAPMWRMNVMTIPDFFRKRYGHVAEIFASLVLVPSYFGWIAAQYLALATILSQVYGWPVSTWVWIVAVGGTGYALMGGMWSITLTDTIQLLLIVVGLILLGVEVLNALGPDDWSTALQRMRSEAPPGHWQIARQQTYSADVLSAVSLLVIGSLGNLPVQDLMQRIFSARSPRIACAACYLGAVGYMLMGLLPIMVGLAAGLILDVVPEEGVLTRVADRLLSPALQIIFLLAIVSAVLSTIVSAVMAPATVLSHNLIEPMLKYRYTELSPSSSLRLQRYCVSSVALASVGLALSGDNAFELVQDAYSISLVGMFVPFVVGIYCTRLPALAANASMLVGCASWLVHVIQDWEHFAQPHIAHIVAIPHEMVDTLLSALAFVIAVIICRPKP